MVGAAGRSGLLKWRSTACMCVATGLGYFPGRLAHRVKCGPYLNLWRTLLPLRGDGDARTWIEGDLMRSS